MNKDWPSVGPNGVDKRLAKHMETNLKRSLSAFEEYKKKAKKSGLAHDQKWLAQRQLDLEDKFQHSLDKFEGLNKAFQPKVRIMMNKVKFALLEVDPIASGKVNKARVMEGTNPVASGKADKARAMEDLISLEEKTKEMIPENMQYVQESPKEN
jgi:hypothetical protein